MILNSFLWCGVLWASLAAASWGRTKQVATGPRHDLNLSPFEILQSGSEPSEVYKVALGELQDLESEPLCHRIAARLLVRNCQLLDGKDEATILTDSGRQIRDFVDSYAASMAICDLERGRFSIPHSCEKFRESTLGQRSLDDQVRLHVTSREIDQCLSGLAAENSAWSTWVSYRHKTLRFCEAARADQEKAQNILLYQRLIKVLAKLTHGVEIELQRHMENLEHRVQKAGAILEKFEPEIDRLSEKLAKVDDYVSHGLKNALKRSGDSISTGLKDATNLQQVLAVMIQTIHDGTSHVAAAQENSILAFGQRSDDLNKWAAVVATVTASALSLNNQIELSRLDLQELLLRQQGLTGGFDRLVSAAESLSLQHEDHARSLSEAQNATNDILDKLDGIAASAKILKEANLSSFAWFGIGGWVPYIISPVATLMLGSYGLAPSALRNLGLVVLGESVAFSVKFVVDRTFIQWPLFTMTSSAAKNMTSEI